MKYLIIIADGAGDVPMAELQGRTALEAAVTPNLDVLASRGILGTAATTPPGFGAGSDVCTMDLLGYDPRRYHTGRAPLEAAAIDVPMGERDWVFRVNLVSVSPDGGADGGRMLDHSAGAITDGEAAALFDALGAHWRRECQEEASAITLRHGVSYRASMVDSSGRVYSNVTTTPPHEIPARPWREYLPRPTLSAGGLPASGLVRLMENSRAILAAHPINVARRGRGLRSADMAWIWGQGTRPVMPSFESRFGLRGAMITAVDLLAGIAKLIGWTRLEVPGVTSYHDTDYVAQGREAVAGLKAFDIVCCHVEAPDEASHQADWATKVAAIEAIDRHVAGPARAWVEGGSGRRVMVLPDHYTLVSTRKHDATPVPYVVSGDLRGVGTPGKPATRFTEQHAKATLGVVGQGHELMELFLRTSSDGSHR
ncbi:MAG: 2,3-bisphosphoglycerate-independent phosphoglycerate mutase [Phycisphaerales bacterium]